MFSRTAPVGVLSFFTISKVKVYAAFTKMRLSSLVVFSAVITYLFAASVVDWSTVFLLSLGGFMVTGASNGFNQILEKDYDKLMKRTRNRPLPSGQMSLGEAFMLAVILGISGVSILYFTVNPLTGLLAAMALIMYVGLYTPMKRVSSVSVVIGAFPGALPPLLGYVAYTGTFGLIPGVLFALQFAWQLPHFWSIAWKLDDDYKLAGYRLLPASGEKDQKAAFIIFLSTLLMIPVGLIPYFIGISGIESAVVITLLGLWMLNYAWKLYRSQEDKKAMKLMFSSFAYLPLAQISLLLDKLLLM